MLRRMPKAVSSYNVWAAGLYVLIVLSAITLPAVARTDDDAPVPANPAGGDDDDAPAPPRVKAKPMRKPAAAPAKRQSNAQKRYRSPSKTSTAGTPKLTKMRARRGYITGRAVFSSGKPMPRFKVSALGWAGEIHLGPSGTLPSLGAVDGSNGRYQIRPTSAYDRGKYLSEALVTVLRADAQLSYKNRKYLLAMHPLDGQRDGDSRGGFRGYVSKGVMRDFVLKMHGPKIGYEKNTPPRDTDSNELSDRSFGAFYGGTVALTFQPDQGGTSDPGPFKNAVMTLTFTPRGSLVDGSAAEPVVRRLRIKDNSVVKYFSGYFRDIPLGDYTLTATLTKPDGSTYPMRLRKLGSDFQSSFDVVFEPWEIIRHVSTLNVYAAR